MTVLNPRVHKTLMARGFHKHTHVEAQGCDHFEEFEPAYDVYEGIGEYVFVNESGIIATERRFPLFEMWIDEHQNDCPLVDG